MDNIKWILKFIHEIKYTYLLAIVLSVLESLSFISSITLQQQLIDNVFIPRNFENLNLLLFLFGVSFVSYAILFTITPHIYHKNIIKLRVILSEKLLNHINNISFQELQNQRTAKFVQNLTYDSDYIVLMVANNIPRGLQQITNIIVLSYLIGTASIKLLIVLFLISALNYWITTNFGKELKNITSKIQSEKSNLLIFTEERISATREVIAFNRKDKEKHDYDKLFQKYLNAIISETKIQNKVIVSSESLKWTINLLCLGYCGYLVLEGYLALGLFIIIYQFTSQLMNSFQMVAQFAINLKGGIAYIERIEELLTFPIIKDGEIELKDKVQNLSLININFSYCNSSHEVLKNLNIHFPINKKIAIVGKSGSGKSTISKLLVRFIEPIEGGINVNNIPLQEIKRDVWSKKVGIIFQDPYFIPDTVRNNITFGEDNVSDETILNACKKACIHDFIQSLPRGYDTLIGDRGINLSGGERQRLAIARALILNPDILILDEATSALDFRTERKIQEYIDRTRKNKTTIIIAHRLSTIKNADIIYVIKNGEVVELGTNNQLIEKKGEYFKMVEEEIESHLEIYS